MYKMTIRQGYDKLELDFNDFTSFVAFTQIVLLTATNEVEVSVKKECGQDEPVSD